jgi:hypothetical protein
MGDDTPGHKADPHKRGQYGRSKPAGLMYLALQSVQDEERQMLGTMPQAAPDGMGGAGGRMVSMPSMGGLGAHPASGMDHVDGGIHDAEMLGIGKQQYSRRRANKTSDRLLDRKTVLSMRLKDHWKRKEDDAKKISKTRHGGALNAHPDGHVPQVPSAAVDDSRSLPPGSSQMVRSRAQGGFGDVHLLGSQIVGMQQARMAASVAGSGAQPPPPPPQQAAYLQSSGPRMELHSPGPAPRLAALQHPHPPHGDPWSM